MTRQESEPSKKEQHLYGIDVKQFVERFDAHPDIWETLRKYPTLCYLLGNVQSAIDASTREQIRDSRPDKVERPIWFLEEGSGMFGLRNPDDAMRWKGIFNHVMGSARNVETVATILKNLTDEQKQEFVKRGYDEDSLENIKPQLLRDFMFAAHARRRTVDEHVWHGCSDTAHPTGEHGDVRDSGELTESLLRKYGAQDEFLELIKVEQHAELLINHEQDEKYTDLRFAILTYCDWIFSQKPVTLDERFDGLQKVVEKLLKY